eukprot:1812227-Rhodomonas_salina.3
MKDSDERGKQGGPRKGGRKGGTVGGMQGWMQGWMQGGSVQGGRNRTEGEREGVSSSTRDNPITTPLPTTRCAILHFKQESDLWEFNLGTGRWRNLTVPGAHAPSPRYYTGLAVHQDMLYAFGGSGEAFNVYEASRYLNDWHHDAPSSFLWCAVRVPRLLVANLKEPASLHETLTQTCRTANQEFQHR